MPLMKLKIVGFCPDEKYFHKGLRGQTQKLVILVCYAPGADEIFLPPPLKAKFALDEKKKPGHAPANIFVRLLVHQIN